MPVSITLRQKIEERWAVACKHELNAVWHYVFGLANRQLVETGLFADPYASTRKYQGDIPAVFANGVL